MIIFVLLYFLERGSVVSGASSAHHAWSRNQFKVMQRTDGNSRMESADDQSYRSSRRERGFPDDDDDVVPQDPNWHPADYEGIRTDAVVSIENTGVYDGYDFRIKYGVRVLSKMVLTVCSAVTYIKPPENRFNYWDHSLKRNPVTKCREGDLKVHVMTTKDVKKVGVKKIIIHPWCTSQYEADLAVVVTKDPIPDSRNVWIHTFENLLFRRNLDKVVAAQGVLGRCSIPIFTTNFTHEEVGKFEYSINFVRVHFQDWDGCKEAVCPYWDPYPGKRKAQDPRRCNNERLGTRYCITWTIPDAGLCDLTSGTPIFCDVGDIQGLMGFLIHETYHCWPFVNKNAIMQGLDDAIPWVGGIARTVEPGQGILRTNIPEWLKNTRDEYNEDLDFIPKVIPRKPKKPSADVTFQNFAGEQYLAVVDVLTGDNTKCRGTLVTALIVVLPCSCVTYYEQNECHQMSNYKATTGQDWKTSVHLLGRDMEDASHIDAAQPVEKYDLKQNRFSVRTMSDNSALKIGIAEAEIHKSCDNHYYSDTAWVLLVEPLPVFKIAWVMTPDPTEFGTMLKITAVADASIGHNCYYLRSRVRGHQIVQKRLIRFLPWTYCIHNICPGDRWKNSQKPRCYGVEQDPSLTTTYCIETYNPSTDPACGLVNGTPIFCDVEEARGLIGFVTFGMEMTRIGCRNRRIANRTAVMHSLHPLLPQIGQYLWITEFTKIAMKENGDLHI